MLLLLVRWPGARAARVPRRPPNDLSEIVEYCVSSKWGFSCLKDAHKLPNLQSQMLIKTASKTFLAISGTWFGMEVIRDLKHLPQTIQELHDNAPQSQAPLLQFDSDLESNNFQTQPEEEDSYVVDLEAWQNSPQDESYEFSVAYG